MTDKMREKFEEWFGFSVGPGMDIQTEVAWDHWQRAWQAALAERPARGEAVAWRFSPYPAAPKFRVLTDDPDAAQFARDCGVAVTELFTAAPAPAVPDGWKLVPVEPTSEMQDAMLVAFYKREKHFIVPELWEAMLAAAPEVPRG